MSVERQLPGPASLFSVRRLPAQHNATQRGESISTLHLCPSLIPRSVLVGPLFTSCISTNKHEGHFRIRLPRRRRPRHFHVFGRGSKDIQACPRLQRGRCPPRAARQRRPRPGSQGQEEEQQHLQVGQVQQGRRTDVHAQRQAQRRPLDLGRPQRCSYHVGRTLRLERADDREQGIQGVSSHSSSSSVDLSDGIRTGGISTTISGTDAEQM